MVARRNAVRGRRLPAAPATDALLPPDVRVAALLAGFRRNVAVRDRRTGSCSSCRSCSSVGRSVEAPGHAANGLVPAAAALAARVLRYSRISAVDALGRMTDVTVWLRVHLGAVETPRHVANRLVPATLALSAGARVYCRIAAVDPFRRMTDITVWLSWIRGSGGGSGAWLGSCARLETPRRIADVRVPAAALALTHALPDSAISTLHSLLWIDVARRSGCNRTPTHCSHCPPQSMRNRVYETVERLSVRLSVPSTDSRDVQRLCC